MNTVITFRRHYGALLRLGIPIIIGQIGSILQGFADTVMVGRYGTLPLSAASFVTGVFTLAFIFALGFSYGLTPVVGRYVGRGDKQQAVNAMRAGVVCNTMLSVGVVAALAVLYFCIDLLGLPQEVVPLIKPYYLINLASVPAVLLFYAYKQFSDAVGKTRTAMWVVLWSNIINIVLNYLMIYGKLGCPEMGLNGAGVATLISRLFAVAAFRWLLRSGRSFGDYSPLLRTAHVQREHTRELRRLGFPIAIQMGMESASFSVCTVYMGWIGAVELAAHQVMLTVGTLCYMLYYGIGAAIAIRISYFFGNGDRQNSRRAAFAGLHIIMLLAAGLVALIFFARQPMIGLFTDSAAVRTVALALVLPMLFYQVGDALQICFANALRGTSDVRPIVGYAFLAYIVVSLPLSYVLAFPCGLGAVGVWSAYPVGLTTAGVLFLVRFCRRTALH